MLASRTYLVGDCVTLADVVGACNLWLGFTKLFDAKYRAAVPNVSRWFDTLVHQPAFAKVLGEVPLAEKAAVYDPAAAKKAAEAPKAAPAAAAPAAAAAGAADPSAPAAPKPKNPLDLLPPSPMALDSWKRLYSNTPAAKFREICIDGLWKGADVPNSPTQEHFPGFDPEGFSIWFCDYKWVIFFFFSFSPLPAAFLSLSLSSFQLRTTEKGATSRKSPPGVPALAPGRGPENFDGEKKLTRKKKKPENFF